VYYNEKDQPKTLTKNTTATEAIIEGLKPLTEYCIKVTGFTNVGESPKGNCFDVETLESGKLLQQKRDHFRVLYCHRSKLVLVQNFCMRMS